MAWKFNDSPLAHRKFGIIIVCLNLKNTLFCSRLTAYLGCILRHYVTSKLYEKWIQDGGWGGKNIIAE